MKLHSSFLPLSWLAFAGTASILVQGASSSPLKSSKARLPSSFLAVVDQLQKESTDIDANDADTSSAISAAVLIPSRTLTQAQLQKVRQQLLAVVSSEDDDEDDSNAKAVANSDTNAILLQPSTYAELAASVIATKGHVILAASKEDLERGEGLYEKGLASAMEQISSSTEITAKDAKLTVLVPDDCNLATAQKKLFQTAEAIGPSSLTDIFGKGVEFIQMSDTALTAAASTDLVTNSATLEEQAGRTSAQALGTSSRRAPADWAAAAQLWTKSQQIVTDCLTTVQGSIQQDDAEGEEDSPMLLNPDFGRLCQAALNTAQSQLQEAAKSQSGSLATELQQQRLAELEGRLHALAQAQLELQHQASLAEFKAALSKLLISPNLAADMQSAAQKCIANFAKAAKQLTCSATADLVAPAKQTYAGTVLEQTKQRLLNARASGKFKPLPRKGVTVGLHWLLPKPFGNDYRQEPWTVHTSQDLVYVPQDKKVMDVAPEDVAAGDWRSKVVPSPVGNDMIYMQ